MSNRAKTTLTPRQQALLHFLRREQKRQGIMPSSREIQQHFGFASQTAAMDLLRALEKKGVIRRLPGKARAVILAEIKDETPNHSEFNGSPLAEIPLYGRIAAGLARETFETPQETLRVDLQSLGLSAKANLFALKVTGDSMIGAHIVQGDLVILETREPRPGDVVAALIDGETTLKRFLTKNGQAYLKAENPAFDDLIPAQELLVQGAMVGLIRRKVA